MALRSGNKGKIIGLAAVAVGALSAIIIAAPNLSALANGKPASAPQQSLGAGVSANWAGYIVPADSGAVSAVSASWAVPTVNGSGDSAIWVGIDGYHSSTAEQIGTEQDIVNGKTHYYAWYEMYPNAAKPIDRPVNPGDTITASVQFTNGAFVFTIQDNNWAAPFTTNQTPADAPQRNSAEWILEAPSTMRGIRPLADFGSVTFTNIQATIGDKTGTLNDWMPVKFDMQQEGQIVAQTGSSDATGDSFTVTYQAPTRQPGPTDIISILRGRGHAYGLRGQSEGNNERGESEGNRGLHLGKQNNPGLHLGKDDNHGMHLGQAQHGERAERGED